MKKYLVVMWSLAALFVWTGCSPYIHETPNPFSQVPVQKTVALKALGERCVGHETCTSGRCIDPGLGFAVCTQECDTIRPCATGASCVHGVCMPSCKDDNDCKGHADTPVCAGGGICWRSQ